MSIESNVDIIAKKFKKMNGSEYKYNLFLTSSNFMGRHGLKSKNNIKIILKQMEKGSFEMPDKRAWFEPDGEGHIEINGTKYGYNTCSSLQAEYKDFSVRYNQSFTELKKRIIQLKGCAKTAKTCFKNAEDEINSAKTNTTKLIYNDSKELNKKIDDCKNYCASTIEKLNYISSKKYN